MHAPRPLLVELANAADDAKALLALIQSGEARLAVALAVVEGDPSSEMTAAAKKLLPTLTALNSARGGRRGPPTI